jgi:hypothetical protein
LKIDLFEFSLCRHSNRKALSSSTTVFLFSTSDCW